MSFLAFGSKLPISKLFTAYQLTNTDCILFTTQILDKDTEKMNK